MKDETNQLKPPRVSVDLSSQLNARLEEISARHGLSKVDIMRRSFALFDVAIQMKERDERMGVFDQEGRLIREIVGIL